MALWKLARPHQWAKSGFVMLGPVYGLQDMGGDWKGPVLRGLLVAAAFALASSGCYAINDLLDAEQDRAHPRKRFRPIARGEVTATQAVVFAGVLTLAAAGVLVWVGSAAVAVILAIYVVNVWLYSLWLKHRVVADVMSLSLGFVLRVFAGCAAVGIGPSTWLLNVTLFLAMFLAFGKRLGERRTMGADAHVARGVQRAYTDELLRMAVVVTAVATLVTYAGYVGTRPGAERKLWEPAGWVNLLWWTILPATYAMLRSIVLLERGRYDDPTEMVVKDWAMRLAILIFAGWSAVVLMWR